MGSSPSKPNRCCLIDPRCGHRCGGVDGEVSRSLLQRLTGSDNDKCDLSSCIGCLECAQAEESCPICLELLVAEPTIRLGCGHTAHFECLRDMVAAVDWPGKEIIPSQLNCPAGCGSAIGHPLLADQTGPLTAAVSKATRAADQASAADGREKPPSAFKVFMCHVCSEPFSDGLKECNVEDDNAQEGSQQKRQKRLAVCESCRCSGAKSSCPEHGKEFMIRKCNYCCQPATFSCGFGWYLFCTPCHVQAAVAHHNGTFAQYEAQAISRMQPCDPARCPFHGKHPKGPTYGWRSLCVRCHEDEHPADCNLSNVTDNSCAPVVEQAQCAAPGCTFGSHWKKAGWNGQGRYCCGACMAHAANSTMHESTMRHPLRVSHHEARCAGRQGRNCSALETSEPQPPLQVFEHEEEQQAALQATLELERVQSIGHSADAELQAALQASLQTEEACRLQHEEDQLQVALRESMCVL